MKPTPTPSFVFVLVFAVVSIVALTASTSLYNVSQLKDLETIDKKKTSNLAVVASYIDRSFNINNQLPKDLAEVKKQNYITSYFSFLDPETKQEFIYRPGEGAVYELCTHFNTNTMDGKPADSLRFGNIDFSTHSDGFYCYSLAAKSNNPGKNPQVTQTTTSTPRPTQTYPTPIRQTTTQPISVVEAPQQTYITNYTYTQPQVIVSTPQPTSPATSCSTLGGQMIRSGDGRGYIGCDIKVNGAIDPSGSYCIGLKTGKTASLVSDAYGRVDQYYATLKDLDPTEQVAVYAKSSNGTTISCSPNLN